MAGGPPQTLSRVVCDPDRLASDAEPLLSTADAAALRAAAAADINRRTLFANRSIVLPNTFAAEHDLDQGSTMTARTPTLPGQLYFRSNTIAPSPPLPEPVPEEPLASSESTTYQPSPLRGVKRNPPQISTDVDQSPSARTDSPTANYGLTASSRSAGSDYALQHKASSSSLKPISRTPSLKHAFGNIGSTCSSTVPSPMISAMGDLTPLPSPLMPGDSPGPWKGRLASSRRTSKDMGKPTSMPDSATFVTANGESVAAALAHLSKRKVYAGIKLGENGEVIDGEKPHGRNRSISEYIPDPLSIPKRQITVSGSHTRHGQRGVNGTDDHVMRREPNFSEARGLTPAAKPPTPPPSESSQSNEPICKKPKGEFFEAYGRYDKKLRRWRALKKLGEGTFSTVVLATSQTSTGGDDIESEESSSKTKTEPDLKTLVAVKVCEHGPRGGASEDRIEQSLKRELEIMKSIQHPSLVHLKAWNIEQTRALLVISYCPGGDLFDFATQHREYLTPSLLRRMFAELVGAVRYLHDRRIVHRDIKLENVLVNVPWQELAKPNQDWAMYPQSILTLTDLGLSRYVADDEKLTTRCGSDHYAAPEVILGQPYDGRAVDAWTLGVLLYALLESRLPFDAPPGTADAHRMRSRTSHRIARIEWNWIEYNGGDGDHDGDEDKFEAKGLLGAMEITEGLIKRARGRWPLEKVVETEWVRGGIRVEGGLKFKEEIEGEEVGETAASL